MTVYDVMRVKRLGLRDEETPPYNYLPAQQLYDQNKKALRNVEIMLETGDRVRYYEGNRVLITFVCNYAILCCIFFHVFTLIKYCQVDHLLL